MSKSMYQTRESKKKLSQGFTIVLKANEGRDAAIFAERVDTLRNVGNVDKPVHRPTKREKANDAKRQRKQKSWLRDI